MPGFDGTGPEGRGSMTGRGMGFCAMPADEYDRIPKRRYYGRGRRRRWRGRGRGRGFGRGYGWRHRHGWKDWDDYDDW